MLTATAGGYHKQAVERSSHPQPVAGTVPRMTAHAPLSPSPSPPASPSPDAALLQCRPRLRPGCTPIWVSNSRLVIGPRPSLDVLGRLEDLADIAAWITTVDGTRTYAAIVSDQPRHQRLLDALIDCGCVLAPPRHSDPAQAVRALALTSGAREPTTARQPKATPPQTLVCAADTAGGTAALSTTPSLRPRPASAPLATDAPVSAECLRQAAARVADDLADDATLVAMRRAGTAITVIGSMPLVGLIENLLTASGVNIADPPAPSAYAADPSKRPAGASSGSASSRIPVVGAIIATLSTINEPRLDHVHANRFQREGIPHMCISVAGSRVLVGPWVVPGVSACTRCWVLGSHDQTLAADGVPAARVLTQPQHAAVALSFAAAAAAARALAAVDGLTEAGVPEVLAWDGIGSSRSTTVTASRRCGCSIDLADSPPAPRDAEHPAALTRETSAIG